MFSKLILVALIAVAAAAPQHQYPAGVHPAKCPSYPICDNALLHDQVPTAWNVQPQAQPLYYTPGDKYPAGVSPASCPNYPYCDVGASNLIAPGPLPSFSQRLYPAGVSASSCPNFPYCDGPLPSVSCPNFPYC